MTASSAENIVRRLRSFASEFDERLAEYLTPLGDVPAKLVEAVRYSALAPGKRIRPFLTVRSCELVGADRALAWPAAAAIECVHAFSLIHDDLPAMDDDDLRRGRPTCHKEFDEATALLAGDALLTLAFELLGTHVQDPKLAGPMGLALAQGTGWSGMIGGQSADLEGQALAPSLERAEYIHERKTARLIETACRLGALAGHADPDKTRSLCRFGQMLGRAFQIADDLLDLTASVEKLGKQVGKDRPAGKQTFPCCIGVEASREAAGDAVRDAIAAMDGFGDQADDLRELARYVVERDY